MQGAREGLTDAVKEVLDRPEEFPQIKGMLGDAIDANHADAHLVEISLGQKHSTSSCRFLCFNSEC